MNNQHGQHARSGNDPGLRTANKRTRPYATDDVYAVIADAPTRPAAGQSAALIRVASIDVRVAPRPDHFPGAALDVEVTCTLAAPAHRPSPTSGAAPPNVVHSHRFPG